jgi:hypothetical protein
MLHTESELRTFYVKYLITIYCMEVEQDMDMGDYPTYEDWLVWYKEEAEAAIN